MQRIWLESSVAVSAGTLESSQNSRRLSRTPHCAFGTMTLSTRAVKSVNKRLAVIGDYLENGQHRQKRKEINEHLDSNPDDIEPVLRLLKSGLAGTLMKAQSGDHIVPDSTTKLSLVSNGLRRKVLSSIDERFTQQYIKQLGTRDKDVLKKLFFFAIAEEEETPVSDDLVDEFLATWGDRATLVGSRLDWIEATPEGDILWPKCGCFLLGGTNSEATGDEDEMLEKGWLRMTVGGVEQWFDPVVERKTHILHRFTKIALSFETIKLPPDTTWEVESNWDERQATLVSGFVRVSCWTMFADTGAFSYRRLPGDKKETPKKRQKVSRAGEVSSPAQPSDSGVVCPSAAGESAGSSAPTPTSEQSPAQPGKSRGLAGLHRARPTPPQGNGGGKAAAPKAKAASQRTGST